MCAPDDLENKFYAYLMGFPYILERNISSDFIRKNKLNVISIDSDVIRTSCWFSVILIILQKYLYFVNLIVSSRYTHINNFHASVVKSHSVLILFEFELTMIQIDLRETRTSYWLCYVFCQRECMFIATYVPWYSFKNNWNKIFLWRSRTHYLLFKW